MENIIKKAINKNDLENNFLFFKKLWKEEFDIDFDKKLEKQRSRFYESEVYFIEEDGKIISSTQMEKIEIGFELTNGFILEKEAYILGRIGIVEGYRGKGLGSKLIKFLLEISNKENIEDFYIPSELGNRKYYAKFGFKEFGKSVKLGNSEYVYMRNKSEIFEK